MIGELYERALEGRGGVEVEDGAGRRVPLPVEDWMTVRPGDLGLLDRCDGPTLDVGSGPGRLTVALTERGLLALGIDIAPHAVALTVAAGGPALCRDVFDERFTVEQMVRNYVQLYHHILNEPSAFPGHKGRRLALEKAS